MHASRRGNAMVVVFILVLVVGVGVFFLVNGQPGSVSSKIPQYVAMVDNVTSGDTGTGEAITGRVAIVSYEARAMDPLHDRLLARHRTDTADQLGAVVVLVRQGTGIGAGTTTGLAPATSGSGATYTIAGYVFKPDGTLITTHQETKQAGMSGAGVEGELRVEADEAFMTWMNSVLP